jgi:hypothetical protein
VAVARRRSFTVKREPIELELGGDTLYAPPVIPPAVLGDLLAVSQDLGQFGTGNVGKEEITKIMETLDGVFGLILVPDSAATFHERLFSRTNPFDLLNEVMPAMEWLIEEYTDRPTQPSPPSSTGPSDGQSSSTSGVPVEASTPNLSPPTASAMPSTPPSTT